MHHAQEVGKTDTVSRYTSSRVTVEVSAACVRAEFDQRTTGVAGASSEGGDRPAARAEEPAGLCSRRS